MTAWRILACAAVLLLSATESLAGEAWRIVQTAGVVKTGGAGFMPAAVQPNRPLPADAWVETGAHGRVVLMRGLETIVLGPDSRVQLPSQEVNGNTQVLQTLGSALYHVGKQKAPHFQVDTPYLAALVKGTTFTVTVTDAISTVDVTEGLVVVATPDGSDSEFVRPGFAATVSRDQRDQVVVEQHRAGSGLVPDAKSKDGPSDASSSVITAPIGEVTLDIKEVSGGLAFAETDNVAKTDISQSADTVSTVGDSTASKDSLSSPTDIEGDTAGTPDLDSGGAMADVDGSGGNAYANGHTKEKKIKTK